MVFANIFDIQKCSYHDGPGIRTVIFFKGCNIGCIWCQNPESVSSEKDLLFNKNNCIKCEKCINICPNKCHVIKDNGDHHIKREVCVKCGKCTEICYSNALQLIGKETSIDVIMKEILTDMEFYKISGGGVTLSGGEPLLQKEACYEILVRCKQNSVNTAIETAGNVNWDVFQKVLPLTDYLLFDIKTIDDEMHKSVCGVSNRQILHNLERIGESKVNLIIRVTVVPGVNDNEENIEATINRVRFFSNLKGFEIIPFHKLGKSKYHMLGKEYKAKNIKEPPLSDIENLKDKLIKMKVPTAINKKT